jgi:hypothetical protein
VLGFDPFHIVAVSDVESACPAESGSACIPTRRCDCAASKVRIGEPLSPERRVMGEPLVGRAVWWKSH